MKRNDGKPKRKRKKQKLTGSSKTKKSSKASKKGVIDKIHNEDVCQQTNHDKDVEFIDTIISQNQQLANFIINKTLHGEGRPKRSVSQEDALSTQRNGNN